MGARPCQEGRLTLGRHIALHRSTVNVLLWQLHPAPFYHRPVADQWRRRLRIAGIVQHLGFPCAVALLGELRTFLLHELGLAGAWPRTVEPLAWARTFELARVFAAWAAAVRKSACRSWRKPGARATCRKVAAVSLEDLRLQRGARACLDDALGPKLGTGANFDH
eukprot:7767012-Alexandrium_andersonii.AAC.1